MNELWYFAFLEVDLLLSANTNTNTNTEDFVWILKFY